MTATAFLQRIDAFVTTHGLLSRNALHLVALSGGADSVALLLALRELGFSVAAVHCNFHLRGDESLRDEDFCRRLCSVNKIDIHVLQFNTREFARQNHVSIEMAARQQRYEAFERQRQDIGAETICVAHHSDDSAETFLLNLARGTGIQGMTGIKPRNGHVVRPLLCVNRKEIEAFLHAMNQPFVTDSTNLKADVERNKIRLQVLPALKEVNPSVSQHIAKTISRIEEARLLWQEAINEQAQKTAVRIRKDHNGNPWQWTFLASRIHYEQVLHAILSPWRFSPSQTEQIFALRNQATGKQFDAPEHRLLLNRGEIIVEDKRASLPSPIVIAAPGEFAIPYLGTLSVNVNDFQTPTPLSKSPQVATLDARLATFPLTVRPVKTGDRFHPLGMNGSRLLSDFMTDNKRSLFEKQRQLVVENSEGTIVWVVGMRPDHRFRITETTATILTLRLLESGKAGDGRNTLG